MQLQGTTIRIACNQAARDSFVNALGGQPPVLPRAGSVRMPCAIFLDDPSVPANLLTDLGNLLSAHCVIRAGDAAGAVLFEQIIPASRFNPALTFAQWTDRAAAHFEFTLTPTDTNLPPGPLHVAVGVTTDAGGDIPLAYCSTARLRDFGIFDAAAPAAPDYTSWSKAEADARYAPRSAAQTCDVYADARRGNDSYHGRTADAPVRTLRAALAACAQVGAGVRLALARGSSWRESLDLSAIANASVQSYGTDGAPPAIDGADVFPFWVKTSGRTHVYQAGVTHDSTDTNRLTVYEDGALLKRVADQAACDATAASFVDVKGSDGSPVTVYIHPTDDVNPASNGHLYEVTTRLHAVYGAGDLQVAGIEARRAISNNGALDATAGSVGAGVVFSRLLTLHGTKHNAVIGAGAVRDSLALFSEPGTSYEPGSVGWTGYQPDPTGQSLLFERCGTVGLRSADYLGHGNGAQVFASSILRQCWTLDTSYPNIPEGSGTRLAEGCYCRGTAQPPNAGTWSQCMIYLPATAGYTDTGYLYGMAWQHSVCYAEARYGLGIYNALFNATSNVSFDHGAFAGLDSYDYYFSYEGFSSGTMSSHHSVYFGGSRSMLVPVGVTYSGDYNVLWSSKPDAPEAYLRWHGTDYTTLASWQAATGQDAHSVYLKAADQTNGNPHAFWLAVKETSSGNRLPQGPINGDWRVNPAARVYGADGTAYVGTFADGTTPITQAGPQNHWDWNARASVAGTPTGWPTVPTTVDDARAYLGRPDAWMF